MDLVGAVQANCTFLDHTLTISREQQLVNASAFMLTRDAVA